MKLLKERCRTKQMIVSELLLNYICPAPYFANAMLVAGVFYFGLFFYGFVPQL